MLASTVRCDMECHECGSQISDKAADCPHCGASVGSAPDDEPTGQSVDDGGHDALDADTIVADTDDSDVDEFGMEPGQNHGSARETGPPDTESARGGEETSGARQGPTPAGSGEGTTPREPTAGPGRPSGGQAPPAQGEQNVGGPPPQGGQDVGGPPPQGDGTDTGAAVGQGPPGEGEESGFDAGEFLGRVPFFPGAAAGFAVGIILLAVGVAYAVLIPNARSSTLELGALVVLDLQFGATGHVTPALFEIFDIVSPRPAAVGFLYLLPPLLLYTAAKLVVALNTDEESTLPEAVVGGPTVLLGYLPVMVIVFVLASREGLVAPTILGLFVAGVVYPVLFGVVGGLMGGGLTGSERRVGTVYALGAVFVIALGCFIATFIATISAPGSPGILTHVLLGTFSWVAANVFVFGGGPVLAPAGILALFVTGLTLVAAAFVRAWRADTESALRGIPKGFTMAPTYLVVLGVYASVVPWLADSYISDQLQLEFLAASYADLIVRARLSGILAYVVVVFFATVLFTVVLTGATSGVATLIRAEVRDE
jgi:hypothetical protein